MTQGDTKFVEDTLRFIKSVGCTVVRTWAFNESKDPTLQKATGASIPKPVVSFSIIY